MHPVDEVSQQPAPVARPAHVLPGLPPLLAGYGGPERAGSLDEVVADPGRSAARLHGPYAQLGATLAASGPHELPGLAAVAGRLRADHVQHEVTFRGVGQDEPFPLDPLPRIIGRAEWTALSAGLVQRVRALEMFLADVYGEGVILRDRVVPAALVTGCAQFSAVAAAIGPAAPVRIVVAGVDVVRDGDGTLRVLEDNLRCPSGTAYVMANRAAMMRVQPGLSGGYRLLPVAGYGQRLLAALRAAAPPGVSEPTVVVLTPGPTAPAHPEHRMLAAAMGVPLVRPRDLLTDRGAVWLDMADGRLRVDVAYRRVDDEELASADGAAVLAAARAGTLVLGNALGNGVADDKGIYTYVPEMIRYYLGEDPLLPNVATLRCWVPDERAEALARMSALVFKPVSGYGGRGIVFGPTTSAGGMAQLRARVLADPRGWIAQPVLDLSTVPTLADGQLVARHVDLRPFVVNDGASLWVMPGGLTRVALAAGSLLVNSSQGGGTKDTWVLAAEPPRPVAR